MVVRTIRGVPIYVEVVGEGPPVVVMHGGPGVDHTTMSPLRRLVDRFTLVFYDHRCNGRSVGPAVDTMTWDNLTADADAIRRDLGFERWAVVGHSFGGMVAMEYALRHPLDVARLVLMDTGGDARWVQEQAPLALAARGHGEATVELASRFFNGRIDPAEMTTAMMRFGGAYYHRFGIRQIIRSMLAARRMQTRPEALIQGFGVLLQGWSVMDKLDTLPVETLVLAGRDDFQFPPEHQEELAARLPNATLRIIEEAGHNAHWERTSEVVETVGHFLGAGSP